MRPLWLSFVLLFTVQLAVAEELRVGFAERDITPAMGKDAEPVWLAGYTAGRKATSVHDPLMVRAIVLQHGEDRIAIASVDLIGLQNEVVLKIRGKLPGYKQITVASTHNHEGPDVIGIWGETLFKRGVNEEYVQQVIDRTVEAIVEAAKETKAVTAAFGIAEDETLLDDRRKPVVKDGVLRAIKFTDGDSKAAGILVQWNCHPEALGRDNKAITADFPAATVDLLKETYACPVVYISGAIGGLMAPPTGRIKNEQGVELKEGDFEYSRKLGEAVGRLAGKAIDTSEPIELTPFVVRERRFAVPVTNRLYRLARQLRVLKREGRVWTGDPYRIGEVVLEQKPGELISIVSEVSCLQLGDLSIVNIPGEIYPELVYGKMVDEPKTAADYPDAPLEPTIVSLLPDKKWMLIGLASDEIGYLIPKRQWDDTAPFTYHRELAQYGEINSCGPDAAGVVMKALADCLAPPEPAVGAVTPR